jgi:hypothetical protein
MLKANMDALTPEQIKLFEAVGLDAETREMIMDLARHAAKNAVSSIQTVAETAHDPRMVNSILLTAMSMVGQAAEEMVKERAAEMIAKMPADLKPLAEAALRGSRTYVAPEAQPKTTGVRDFDGNYG